MALFGILLPMPLLFMFVNNWQQTDWANPPSLLTLLISVLFFCLLPATLGGAFFLFALFGKSTELQLNPRTSEAILKYRSVFGKNISHYPLNTITLEKVGLKEGDATHDEPFVALRMPDGKKLKWRASSGISGQRIALHKFVPLSAGDNLLRCIWLKRTVMNNLLGKAFFRSAAFLCCFIRRNRRSKDHLRL